MLKIALTVNAGSYKFVGKKEGRGMKYGEGLHRSVPASTELPRCPGPLLGAGMGKTRKENRNSPRAGRNQHTPG